MEWLFVALRVVRLHGVEWPFVVCLGVSWSFVAFRGLRWHMNV